MGVRVSPLHDGSRTQLALCRKGRPADQWLVGGSRGGDPLVDVVPSHLRDVPKCDVIDVDENLVLALLALGKPTPRLDLHPVLPHHVLVALASWTKAFTSTCSMAGVISLWSIRVDQPVGVEVGDADRPSESFVVGLLQSACRPPLLSVTLGICVVAMTSAKHQTSGAATKPVMEPRRRWPWVGDEVQPHSGGDAATSKRSYGRVDAGSNAVSAAWSGRSLP